MVGPRSPNKLPWQGFDPGSPRAQSNPNHILDWPALELDGTGEVQHVPAAATKEG